MQLDYTPRGSARELFHSRDPEILLSGPAGTGKSRGALEKLHLALCKYPGARALILRKTLNSLTSTGLVTYREQVLHPLDGVRFFSGNKEHPAHYIYPRDPHSGRHSVLVVGGLDNPAKVMSADYDIAFIQEAIDVSVNDWESVTTRLRHGVMPYQQLIGDTNPSAPHHWLKQRCDSKRTLMLYSRHEENPRLFTADGAITDYGLAYMAKLDALTGVRLQRLRYGRWVAAEGIVYEGYDRAIHLLNADELPRLRRYVVAVDWGFTNAGVMTVWGLDSDGRMYLIEEVYHSRKLMDWWIEQAIRIKKAYHPEIFVCDPAEPAFILQLIGKGLAAIPGFNEIRPGIEAVQNRLQPAGDRKPRLFIKRDALTQIDPELLEAKKPHCLDQEMDSYVWPEGIDGKPLKEKPIDEDNHALDTLRYAVAYIDHIGVRRVSGDRAAVSGPRASLTQQDQALR